MQGLGLQVNVRGDEKELGKSSLAKCRDPEVGHTSYICSADQDLEVWDEDGEM